jgi:hypothetical protein
LVIHKHSFAKIATHALDTVAAGIAGQQQGFFCKNCDLDSPHYRTNYGHGFFQFQTAAGSVDHAKTKCAASDVDWFLILVDKFKQQNIVNSFV